jgi:hypothetical protein
VIVLAGKVKLCPSWWTTAMWLITITVDSPMTPANHVKAIALFNENCT